MSEPAADAVSRYCLSLGDDALVLSQRLCEWAAESPAIEEDVALMNVALDLLGQARSFLSYAGEREGAGRTEDDLAYLRNERDFCNVQLVEVANGDFATTMVRQLLFSAYQYELYGRLTSSCDAQIAAISAKALKEVAYHREHAALWVLRLGDGTEESHRRMVVGLHALWPYAGEMFQPLDWAEGLVGLVSSGVATDPVLLHEPWSAYVTGVLSDATLDVPTTDWAPAGGRGGIHTEGFGYLLAEMQHVHRSFPGATW